mmetsp:Transcript_17741/g.41112  ORF Transcript_17741/g.41112 Transcript_17741/m.41112 type:complete len:84 (+) Transcript_17741:609-860(+)
MNWIDYWHILEKEEQKPGFGEEDGMDLTANCDREYVGSVSDLLEINPYITKDFFSVRLGVVALVSTLPTTSKCVGRYSAPHED